MKRLIIIYTLLCISVAAIAQRPENPQMKRVFERIQAEKIAFFTNELDLTPEEAQKFWPVYNQYSKEERDSHFNTMAAFDHLNSKDGEKLSDKEIEKRIDDYIKAVEKESSLTGVYYPKFKAVLPMDKVAKLYRTEEAFRMRMINHVFPPMKGRNQ